MNKSKTPTTNKKTSTRAKTKLTKEIEGLLREHKLPIEHAKDVAEIISNPDLLAPHKRALSLGIVFLDYNPKKKADKEFNKGDALWEDIETMILDTLPAGELLGLTFDEYNEWDNGGDDIPEESLPTKRSEVTNDILELVQKLAKFDSDAIDEFKQVDVDAVQKRLDLSCLKKADSITSVAYLSHLLGIVVEEVLYDEVNVDSDEGEDYDEDESLEGYEPASPIDVANSKSLENWLNADPGLQAMHWLHSWLHESDWLTGEDDVDDYLIALQSQQDDLIDRMTFVAQHFKGTITPIQFIRVAEGILADEDALISIPYPEQGEDEHAGKVNMCIFTIIMLPLVWHGVLKQKSGRLALPQPNDKLTLDVSALQALRLARLS